MTHGRYLILCASLVSITACGRSNATGPSSSPSSRGCTITLSRTQVTVREAGGPTSFIIRAPRGCTWTVTSTADWITPPQTASGDGDQQVVVTVARNNTLASRTGTVTVGSQTLTVEQEAPDLTGRWGAEAVSPIRAIEFSVRGTDIVRVRITYNFTFGTNRTCDRAFTADVLVPIVENRFVAPFVAGGITGTLAVEFQSPTLAAGILSQQTFTNVSCGPGPPFSTTVPGGIIAFGPIG